MFGNTLQNGFRHHTIKIIYEYFVKTGLCECNFFIIE